jgi:hypothetical protein
MTVFAWLCMAQNEDYRHQGTAPYLNLGVENADMPTFLSQYLCLIRKDKQLSELIIPLTDLPEESPRSIDYETYPEYMVDEMKVFKTLVIKKDENAREEIVVTSDYKKMCLTFICNMSGLEVLLHGIIHGSKFGIVLLTVFKTFKCINIETNEKIERSVFFWVVQDRMPMFCP